MNTSSLVLATFLISIVVTATRGLIFEKVKKVDACAARHFILEGRTFDVFCMAVKDGELSYKPGTGCFKNTTTCDYGVTVYSETNETIVFWTVGTRLKKAPKITFVLSREKTSTASKKGEVYRQPPNAVAIGNTNYVRLTNKDGRVDYTNDENCIIRNSSGILSRREVYCKFNGFQADLYKDKLYATLVALNDYNELIAEHHPDSAIVLLESEGLGGWAIAGIVIGCIIGFLLLVALIAGIVYYAIKTSPQVAPAIEGEPKTPIDNM